MGRLNLQKIRTELDLAAEGETIRLWFSASPSQYIVHSHS